MTGIGTGGDQLAEKRKSMGLNLCTAIDGCVERGSKMDKRRILIWSIIGLAIVSVVLSLYFGQRAEVRRLEEELVVVVRMAGAISESDSPFTTGITPEGVRRQLSAVLEDPSIDAVVLRIDSSGGSVAASQEISSIIRAFPLPVVVSMGDMALSGGYFIAAASDGIVAHPGTMTGSIGVILTAINPEGLYEKLGIEMEVITSGEHKDLMQRSLDDEDRQLLQSLSDEAYRQFVEHVAEGRGMSMEAAQDVATGEIFFGTQAYDLGLVDRLGGEEEAIELAAERAGLQTPQRHELPPPAVWRRLRWLGADVFQLLQGILQPDELKLFTRTDEYFYPRIRY